ncbi:MAG TPA: DUF3426 domain-containing protein, partial [Woeseiaceae bacterium]
TAFPVTAPDLQRAGGRIVCRGCSRDFNALERLTEDPSGADEQAAEEKSLLDTLNELSGPHEIRIEDTGVEWRVIDDDDDDTANIEFADDLGVSGDDIIAESSNDLGNDADDLDAAQMRAQEPDTDQTDSLRWYIDDLPDEPTDVLHDAAGEALPDVTVPQEAVATYDPDAQAFINSRVGTASLGMQDSFELPSSLAGFDVQRYDDNTPLPDDFLEHEAEPATPQRRADDRLEPRSPEADEAQVDLALGEPGDWVELLDEVGQRNEREVPGDDDWLSDTDIQPSVGNADPPLPHENFPSDLDTQFDLQAIELGIELTGSRKLALRDQNEWEGAVAREEPHQEPPGIPREYPDQELTLEMPEEELATDVVLEQEIPAAAEVGAVQADGSDAPAEQVAGAEEWLAIDAEALRPEAANGGNAAERLGEQAFEQQLPTAHTITLDVETAEAPHASPDTEHVVPPPTEEEMTINLLIDQDLIRLAEQQDVFTPTSMHKRLDDAPRVETIIMEGDFIRNVLEGDLLSGQKQTVNSEAYSRPDHLPPSADRSAAALARAKGVPDADDIPLDPYAARNEGTPGRRRFGGAPAYRLIAGVAALTLLFAAQVVHAYRDTLATFPMFDRTVGSVYRLLGAPLNPDWDIRKWRFEATSGSTDEMDEVLTISSRLANSSARPLPYPLLHVSLTDRWEEIIGSNVLGPHEYLAGGGDDAGQVAPGESFTALVRVEAPAPAATGFKLNVCYPEPGGRVRCATEDFKD